MNFLLLKELAAQHANDAQALLRKRRNGKLWLIGFIYGLLMIGGAGAGALYAGNASSALFAYGLGISLLAFAGAALFHRFNIERSEKALDRSLDIIAAARGMAYENKASEADFEALTAQYRALTRERARRLFERALDRE